MGERWYDSEYKQLLKREMEKSLEEMMVSWESLCFGLDSYVTASLYAVGIIQKDV